MVVLVSSDSVGTRKTSLAYPPGLASGDDTVTWADAEVAAPARTSMDAAAIAAARRTNFLDIQRTFHGHTRVCAGRDTTRPVRTELGSLG